MSLSRIGQHNQSFGKSGEEIACVYLETSDYLILDRNFRCSLGEIDIIAEKKHEITFFEVKTRTNLKFGPPSEIINCAKLKRMEQIAWIYLRKIKRENVEWGIKIVEVMDQQCKVIEPLL